ncbi:MAG: PE-PPE domain-containing protein [Mycobacterium sp.]|uniref:PE-PPE domain-containing protein n=1 Tax=Mycobacterium sp. TaxID=1785 RepID=UPI003F9A10AF
MGITSAAMGPAMSPGDPIYTLVLGASGYPIPSQEYIDGIPPLYANPFWGTGTNIGINTPEGLYPLTGVMSLPLNTSLSQGLTILNNAIQSLATPGNTINVFGYSQSAIISSLEMQALNPTNTLGGSLLPSGVNLNFTLVGDPSNPNGGLFARFPGLSLPSLGLTFGTATPDNSFPTRIDTIEYDGFADFPQYPIDVLSDLNAFLGILTLHGQYPFLTPTELTNAVSLTNTAGPTQTEYFIIPTSDLLAPGLQGLPLLDPVRAIPVIGNPIADLLQPDLTVLVDLGYGSTTQGWSTGPPNVATPFGVLPPVPLHDVLSALGTGAQQGVSAFWHDIRYGIPKTLSLSDVTSTIGTLGTNASSYLSAGVTGLTSALSSPDGFITALQSANTNISNAISGSASAVYSTLLPTADVVNALVTSVPSYDVNLFLSGVEQIAEGDPVGGLIYAFGAPLAADTALVTLFGGFEARVFEHAATQIIDDIRGTAPAPPGTVSL